MTIVRSEVDHDGVLHTFYEPPDDDDPAPVEPPRPARPELRKTQGRIRTTRTAPAGPPVATHQFDRDYYDPMVCRYCGLPETNRRHDAAPASVSDDSGMPDEGRS